MPATTRGSCRRFLRVLSRVPGAYTLLAFLCARRVTVSGWSMYPAVRPGERALFDRLAYIRSRPRRGDVVLAKHPARPELRLVKRIAAAPGEAVTAGGEEGVLARDEYWLLGDALASSTDSRQLGMFRRQDILARGWLVYWPPERFRTLRRGP